METYTNTMRSVLWTKVIDETDQLTLGELVSFLGKLLTAAFIAGAMTDTTLPARLMMWQHYLIPNTLFVSFLVFKAPSLWNYVHETWEAAAPQTTGDSIEGIPTVELLDHLFTSRSMKVREATEKFHVPQYRVESLVKKLKEIEVLVPGANNASVLNTQMSRQDVASILKGKSEARQLEPLFRKDALGFTSRPSMPEIQERADTPPPRAPGFVSRISAAAS